jgi:phage terminase large subunit-like protein
LAEMKGKYAETVLQYARGVVDGSIVAGEDRILGCRRFLRMIEDPRFEIQTQDADFVIGIIEKTFKHRQGQTIDSTPMRGKPFLLEPWEKFCVYGMLIFFHPGTNERLVKEAFIFIPRKNAKTLFISALSWALGLLERKSGSKVYVVGAALKQAMETFDNWDYNVRQVQYGGDKKEAALDGWKILDNSMEHSISNEDIGDGSIYLIALASNPDQQDSFNCNIVIADEMHAYKSPKQYNVMREATKAYTNKLIIGITSAGDNGNGFCAHRLRYCRRILNGERVNDTLFIFICAADQGEKGYVDFTNPIQHQKANPNYGVTIRPEQILQEAREAEDDPQQRKDFLAKSLNIFTSSIKTYFNIAEFKDSNRKAEAKLGIDPAWTTEQKLDYLTTLDIQWYGGADLAKMHDLTAGALHGQYGDIDIAVTHAWFPIVAATRKADEDDIPLFGWQEDGWLDMSNAPTTNHAEVINWFIAMRDRGFRIEQVGHDPKFCREYFIGMEKAEFNIVVQLQRYIFKSEGFRHIEKKAKEENLYYLGSEAYEYCVQNVAAIEKTDDMIQYEKVEETSRIDIFDADVFATIRMLEDLRNAEDMKGWE